MINVVDRVSTYPGRVKLTRADGTVEYVTWERADEPTVPGTPINKALFDSIAADIGLTSAVTVYVSKSGSDTLGNGSSSNPYLTIMKVVNSLPKNLNGFDATISIGAGTYSEHVDISRFSGGLVKLSGATGEAVSINSLRVGYGSFVQLENITLTVTSNNDNAAINVTSANFFALSTVRCTAATRNGVFANRNAYCQFSTLDVSNTTEAAVTGANGSVIWAADIQGSSNTGYGLRAENGSRIAYDKRGITATTIAITGSGGRILTGAQA